MRARLPRWIAGAIAVLLIAAPATAADGGAGRFDRLVNQALTVMMADPATALARANEAQRAGRSLGNVHARALAEVTTQRLVGEAYLGLDRAAEAGPLLATALRRVRELAPGSKLEADILLSQANLHALRGDTGVALGEYQNAHRLFQRAGARKDQAMALLCIAGLYGDATDWASALKYIDQAVAVRPDEPFLMLSIFNNRATTLQELKRYPEAEAGYRRALAIAERMASPLLEARILGNIARVRLKRDDVVVARVTINRALAIASGGDVAASRLQLIGIAAQVALQERDYQRAEALIGERFAGIDLATTTIAAREAHQTAYDTYRALGDAPKALAHLAALKRLDDQATRLATSANAALAAAAFDFKNQEVRLANLKAAEADRQVEVAHQRARTQRLLFIGFTGAAAVIIALLAFGIAALRRSRDRERAVSADLTVSNAALGKALAAKTEFLATTSHEIRTPLNGILGMTQVMLADMRLSADTRERVGVVHAAGTTMRALVDDILDVSKMETGNLTIEHVPFDLCSTLSDAARLWRDQATAKGLRFTLDLADCPARIEGDAARVRQIVFNLLANAVKFTAAGEVSLRAGRQDGRYRITITDSGIGIDAAEHENIFESFRQADAGTTRQFGGTGLGLSICRNLARAMGGDVTVASTPGAGAAFSVDLPLTLADAEPASAPAPDGSTARTFVVVDANPISRAMLASLIARRCESGVAVASLDDMPAVFGPLTLIVDQSASSSDDACGTLAAIRAGGNRIVLLWKGDVPPDLSAAATVVVPKPVGGQALLAVIFDEVDPSALVPRAA